ncbi:YybH family protein [Nocardioides speluncae]|uniref:YybH family protein n=1 Tax=Nocardioides speluncae TaxID=2670337 RepID=UPI000D68BEEB|nr:nuclear transport factor 2 family protein [Nocardioides speluncae]
MLEPRSEIEDLIAARSEAIAAKDLDRLMALYAADVVYFDLVPPLRYVGSDALRDRFAHWFQGWRSAIGQEVRDLTITASGDIATAHMLIRASGTRQSGEDVGFWVRASDFCQRQDRGWLITHDHISLPVDLATGRGVHDLLP